MEHPCRRKGLRVIPQVLYLMIFLINFVFNKFTGALSGFTKVKGPRMGSNNKRRQSDQVIVRPRSKKDGTGSTEARNQQSTCPTSFHVGLRGAYKGYMGAPLHLRQEGNRLAVFLRGEKIATLLSNRSETISRCMQSGFRYVGVVRATRTGKAYGEFIRTP